MDSKNNVVVRFPPSPTGLLHMGNVRTLIYNYLFARKLGGKLLLRIENTDKERSRKEYEEEIYESIKWLGLDYDNKEKVWRSSERTEIYKEKIQELIKKGAAYISKETEGENREVVRFKNPGGKIKFLDLIRGEIEIDVSDLGDFIIARNINDPLYHLAVCVDDSESQITHIIRGDDHISNTPRHILILEALGLPRPIYAHPPLILAPDKSKLSKRKHGEIVSLKYYREKGYEPEAVLNFLAMIGWNPGTDQEIFTLPELIEQFDLSKVQKKGGIFNVEKLDWINKQWILRQKPDEQFSIFSSQFSKTKYADHEKLKDTEFMQKFLKIILDRIHRWGEVAEVIDNGEFDYLFDRPDVGAEMVVWKKQSKEDARKKLQKILDANFEDVAGIAEKEGRGEVLWPLRTSLSGREKSPDPYTLLDILGTEEATERLKLVIEKL